LEVKIEMVGDVLLVRLQGEFDLLIADEFREAVDPYFESGRAANLLLDISRVSFMDSSGLGAILGRYKKIRQMGGNMIIVGARPQIKKILELSGIMKIISFYDNEKSALAELS